MCRKIGIGGGDRGLALACRPISRVLAAMRWGPTLLSQHAPCDLLRGAIIDKGAAPELLQGGAAEGLSRSSPRTYVRRAGCVRGGSPHR